MLQNILHHSRDLIICLDTDMQITEFNKKAEEALSIKKTDCIGQSLYETIPCLGTKYSAFFSVFFQDKKVKELPKLQIDCSDKKKLSLFDLHLSPIEEEGIFIGACLILREVKEDILTREGLYYNHFFKNTSSAIIITYNGKIKRVNESFTRMFGYNSEEATKLGVKTITHPDFWEDSRLQIEKLSKGEVASIRIHKKYLTKNGETIDCINNTIGIYNKEGVLFGCVSLIENISDIVIEENRLREINEQVFLVAHEVAHDMREPILTIRLFSELLKSELQENLFPKEKEYLDFIISGAIRAENFIREILNGLPGREHGKSSVDLNEVIMVVQSSLQKQIIEKRVSLYPDFLPKVHGNTTLLTQLFQNLISNLIKLSSRSKETFLKVTPIESDDQVQIIINDKGLWLIEDELENCFKPFFIKIYPIKNLGIRSYIGLSIAKKIVDFHDASCVITSNKEQGTSIILTFRKEGNKRNNVFSITG